MTSAGNGRKHFKGSPGHDPDHLGKKEQSSMDLSEYSSTHSARTWYREDQGQRYTERLEHSGGAVKKGL